MRTNWFSFVEWSSSDSIVGKMASIILFIMFGSNWIPVSSLIKWFSFIFYSLGDCVVCCCGAICIFRSIANMGKTFLYCIKKIKFFSLAVCRRSYSEMQKRQHQQRQRETGRHYLRGVCAICVAEPTDKLENASGVGSLPCNAVIVVGFASDDTPYTRINTFTRNADTINSPSPPRNWVPHIQKQIHIRSQTKTNEKAIKTVRFEVFCFFVEKVE